MPIDQQPAKARAQRAITMLALVCAGEAVFGLPFLVARLFRPTLLDVFAITNLQLGTAFSFYGVIAMLAYFPGGPIADRFPARKLMTAALIISAMGGIYYATIPSLRGLRWLFAFWGLTTILLFWSALIRATRNWGGDDQQGAAFGLLDSGRGLLAALLATATTALYAGMVPAADASLLQRGIALQWIIAAFTLMTVLAAGLVWATLPPEESDNANASKPQEKSQGLAGLLRVLRLPKVWLQALIVVMAYTGYKGMDNIGLYAKDAFKYSEVAAASLATLSFWIRPVAALGAGLVGDRIGSTRAIVVCFALMFLGNMGSATGLVQPAFGWSIFVMVVTTSAAVFSLRALYFAIFEEAGVPTELTGTAAGLVSVLGYTPDISMGPLMGYLTDSYPGALGHRYFFGCLALFAVLGLVATLVFQGLGPARQNAEV